MARTKKGIDINKILSLPVTTNRIDVSVDKKAFLDRYDIVSYYSVIKDKNLAYEYLSDQPCVSVAGIYAKYDEGQKPYTKFFVLVEHGQAGEILGHLRKNDSIRAEADSLEGYRNHLQERILASLALNSLGIGKSGQAVYCNGKLIVCDDTNFGISKFKKEQVCLRIEINEYMILTAKTVSYSHPLSEKVLLKNQYGAFRIGKGIGGASWMGNSIKPVVLHGKHIEQGELDNYFIQKKRLEGKKNVVPYWPYNPQKYNHGKLFVLWNIVEMLNKKFSPMLSIKFHDYPVEYYNEYESGNDMLDFIRDYFSGKSIVIENPFKEKGAKKMIKDFKEQCLELTDGSVSFPSSANGTEMQIRLCEPKDDKSYNITYYSQSIERMARNSNALQHIIFHNDEKEDSLSKSEVRRILVELIVKDCLSRMQMPLPLRKAIDGWTFYRYKVKDGGVHGASLNVNIDGKINITPYGTFANDDFGSSLESFALKHLMYTNYQKINGYRDYMALTRHGNSYIIIDTDEIPILDAQEIDASYENIVNNGETVSMFKRKDEAHKYLRGYIGFHLWKEEGLEGESSESYSYISGHFPSHLQILMYNKMDKMPRARRIFILHAGVPERIKDDILKIANMMRFGLGRWNEEMTYPFPFKYLYEFLDNECEIKLSKHWNTF